MRKTVGGSFSFLKKYLFITLVPAIIFSLVFTFSGCETQEKVIKIGNQAILSGDDKFFGEDQLITLDMAVSELSPVKIGGFDYEIDIITKDDEGNAEKAFLLAQEFVEENVSSVIGPIFNGTVKASIPVYAEYSIPMVTPSAQGVDISRGFNNFYRMIINNSQKIENIADFLVAEMNPEKLILIDNGEEYSVKLVDHMVEIFESRNISFHKRYSIKFDTGEYDVLAENLFIDEPDVVFFCAEYNEVAALLERTGKLELKCQYVTEEMGMDDAISEITDNIYLEGLVAVIPDPPSLAKYSENQKAIDFWRKYNDYTEKMDGQDLENKGPGPYAPYTYDAIHILINAMKKANSVLPEDFSDELKATSYDGIAGLIEFNSNGDRVDPQSTVFIMKNGDWVRLQ
jgi:branched-chain amino acid transport system substrate-binding protein